MTGKRKSNSGFGMGFLRPFGAVLVLTAFILSITFTVKALGQLNASDVISKTKPLLAKINININMDDNRIGQVAGSMISRISNSNLAGGGSSERVATDASTVTETVNSGDSQEPTLEVPKAATSEDELFKIALLADVHSDYENLNKALDTVKKMDISTVLFLGDFTKLGLIDDLNQAKSFMDNSGLKYYALAGDHDLWKSVGFDNFIEVFGKNNQAVTVKDSKFVLLDNSANYSVISEETMTWFKKEVTDADFIVLSQPLYYPKLDRYMGRINGEDVTEVLAQRNELLTLIRASNVKAVISADLHKSDSLEDPEKSSLKHILVGALTRSADGTINLQSPRFSVFKFYKDGSYDLQDVVLE